MSTSNNDLLDKLGPEFERLLSVSPTVTCPARPARPWGAEYIPPSARQTAEPVEPERPRVITLDVAGRLFKVSSDILIAESGLFERQLSARYNWVPQRDGTYFLDADPVLFEHLLNFMRRPSAYPVFWSQDQGYDYNLYQRLQAEAEYFQMDGLHNWIKEKKYLQAITIRAYQPETRELRNVSQERLAGNLTKDWHYVPKVRKTYMCPRGIQCHYGNRDACGRACRKYQGDDDTEYDEEEYLEVVSVKKEIVFDEEVCKPR